MLLTIDLGNTCIKLGLFKNDEAIAFHLFDTVQEDYRTLLLSFIYKANVREDQVDDIIISSVVPKVKETLLVCVENLFHKKAIEIDVNKNFGITLDIDDPKEIGQDLLVMCAYAYNLYHRDLLVCSLGTCSALCYVSDEGSLKYAVIAPGFNKMAEILYNSAALLPEFTMEKKNSFLATNTVDAMNVGFYNGFLGMIEYLISNIQKELGKDLYIVACGGGSKDVAPYTKMFDVVDPDFVTNALNYLYNHYYA